MRIYIHECAHTHTGPDGALASCHRDRSFMYPRPDSYLEAYSSIGCTKVPAHLYMYVRRSSLFRPSIFASTAPLRLATGISPLGLGGQFCN